MNPFKISRKLMFTGVLSLSLAFTGCLTDGDDDNDPDPTTTAWQNDATISVGAQGHLTLGTAMDLDAADLTKAVLLSAAANAAQATIDLLFVHSGGAHMLMNPVAAKAATDVAIANNYNSAQIKNVMFVKVSAKPANVEAGTKAYNDGTKLDKSVVTGGEIFVVKTTADRYVVVTVKSIAGTEKNAAADLTLNLAPL